MNIRFLVVELYIQIPRASVNPCRSNRFKSRRKTKDKRFVSSVTFTSRLCRNALPRHRTTCRYPSPACRSWMMNVKADLQLRDVTRVYTYVSRIGKRRWHDDVATPGLVTFIREEAWLRTCDFRAWLGEMSARDFEVRGTRSLSPREIRSNVFLSLFSIHIPLTNINRTRVW